jgi:hypothetical protein
MHIEQRRWTSAHGWEPSKAGSIAATAQLVLVFGATAVLRDAAHFTTLRRDYPKAYILGCSTAGEIMDVEVTDDTLVTTAIQFDHTRLAGAQVRLSEVADSLHAGEKLARALPHDQLTHVFVISDGLHVNGTDLVKGLSNILPPGIAVTGGLAGDGPHFGETLVCYNAAPQAGLIAAIGFYGDKLKVGYGSLGGWDSFGPERLVTRSNANVLYELDGQSALALYKTYLGDHAHDLPASGLLFPLSLRTQDGEDGVVRTILGVSEVDQSLTFAGDIPTGSYARLMKANFDRLIDGAMGAAQISDEKFTDQSPELAILVSCVGRKLVLKQRTEDELESVRDVLGADTVMTGFYSYGEICPTAPDANCKLHNQTMTITTFSER